MNPLMSAQAACRSADPDLWFPEKNDAGGQVRKAIAICNGCPIRVPCGEWAIEHNEVYGIWGGLGARERQEIRRRSRRVRRQPAVHGGLGMYTNRGCRCGVCRQGKADYEAGRRVRRVA